MKKNLGLMIPFVFAALFNSCDLFNTTVYVKFDQKTFNEQRQLWQESNINNYQYKFSASGFTVYIGTIIVENGNFKNDIPSTEYSDSGLFMSYSSIDEVHKTIEETFVLYNNTKQSKKDFYCTDILVEYDKINHIPVKIDYRYYCPPTLAVDGTFYYEINDFAKLD